MRILHVVHQYFPHHRGGVERSTRELARAQRAAGHRVHIVAGERGRLTREWSTRRETVDGLPLTRLFFNPREPGAFLQHDGFAARWAALLHDLAPDIVHVQHLHGLSLSLLHATADAGVPLVYTLRDTSLFCARQFLMRGDGSYCHATDLAATCAVCLRQSMPLAPGEAAAAAVETVALNLPSLRSWWLAGQAALRRAVTGRPEPVPLGTPEAFGRRNAAVINALGHADRLIAISVPLAQRLNELAETAGLPGDPIQSLPQSPATDGIRHRHRTFPHDRPFRIGFLGKLAAVKGPDVLLQAFAALPAGRAELHLYGAATRTNVGEVAFARRLRALAQSTPGATLHPPSDNLPAALDGFDLFVAPSVGFEGYHRGAAEALAAGLPVVCSENGGFTGFVRDEVNGLHVANGDAAALTLALQRFLDDPALLGRLSANARAPRQPEAYAAELDAVYQELAG